MAGEDLSSLEGLFTLYKTYWQTLWPAQQHRVVRGGTLYCPTCGDERRMAIAAMFLPDALSAAGKNGNAYKAEELVESLFVYSCVQCNHHFTATVYQGPEGSSLVVLPSVRGGLTTPHTPEGVAFYLDQAYRSRVMGANSAAIAMFRGALEHLLFEQGYTKGMLGAKLTQLESDIQAGTAPKWAIELEPEFLQILRDLGNGAIHPNDGDVSKQSALDSTLLNHVQQTFLMLLFHVYEVPQKKAQQLGALKAAAQVLKK